MESLIVNSFSVVSSRQLAPDCKEHQVKKTSLKDQKDVACGYCERVVRQPHNPDADHCSHIDWDGEPGCDDCLQHVDGKWCCYGCSCKLEAKLPKESGTRPWCATCDEYNETTRVKADGGRVCGKCRAPQAYKDGKGVLMKQCAACASPLETPKQCSRCKSAWYCDRECQAQHWKEHKPTCVAPTPEKVND